MTKISIVVEGDELDMFKSESIVIDDKIREAKEVGKIFTSVGRDFNLPATRRTNQIFKHFYDLDMKNGFDARVKIKATIQLNSSDYAEGFLELIEAKKKNGKIYSYHVFFNGLLSELKEIVKNDKLSDLLQLSEYNHIYSDASVKLGFRNYCNIDSNGNLVATTDPEAPITYPFLTHTKRYTYDTNDIREVNKDTNAILQDRLVTSELKPALRLVKIIKAIEYQYRINFTPDFFNSNAITELFMWLHRDKGVITSSGQFDAELDSYSDFTLTTGSQVFNSNGDLVAENQIYSYIKFFIDTTIIVVGEGSFNYEVIDEYSGDVLASGEFLNVTDEEVEFSYSIIVEGVNQTRSYRPLIRFSTIGEGITSVNFKQKIREQTEQYAVGGTNAPSIQHRTGYYDKTGSPIVAVGEVRIREQIPSMTVIDFLKSLFRMYNLVAYVQKDGAIYVDTLDNYYASGKTYDISNMIDISEENISRLQPYSEVNFAFQDPSSFLIKKHNEKFDREFGNLRNTIADEGEIQNKKFSGGTYSIDVSFEKMIYEKMSDGSVLTPIVYGRFVDEKQEPTFGKPLIFYTRNTSVINNEYSFEGGTTSYDNMITPSNSGANTTINFGAEIDEYTLQQNNESLYKLYYSNYIKRIFSKRARILKLSGVFRLSFILNYNLNDTLIYRGKPFNINRINIDLSTGQSDVELINTFTDIDLGKVENLDQQAESLIEEFVSRSEIEGGTFEARECLKDTLKEIELTKEYYITTERLVEVFSQRSGTFEARECLIDLLNS